MSNTSEIRRSFVAEPMTGKPVTDLAGIGETIGKRLSDAGFDMVIVCKFNLLDFERNFCYLPNEI